MPRPDIHFSPQPPCRRALPRPGLYRFNLTLTRAGPFSLFVGVAYGGGLAATYYHNDSDSARPAAARLDPQLDFAGPPWAAPAAPDAAAGGGMYAVTWSGLGRPGLPPGGGGARMGRPRRGPLEAAMR